MSVASVVQHKASHTADGVFQALLLVLSTFTRKHLLLQVSLSSSVKGDRWLRYSGCDVPGKYLFLFCFTFFFKDRILTKYYSTV